ncbi:MAG: toxic anion resistance protein [Methanobrevibacter sp.]|uniref:toxic anion resistance protein n=1 Tax=Methanobrevibacter sp. TaxID=66852 RepID=UPI002580223D|nr:toxic anion resistance protein [Methanobrevibacter sp.]MBR2664921.1 toxic anion resistance protein [Methanobrevibacter sp.]MBR3198298.1 toxic anion resistance protein [Methanobrevibacter sp.]MBR7051325.1 toxic anion resistance protein [Methanobrevibacter sp.]
MSEFSLDVDEIKKDVETSLKDEEEKLENSNLKDQAQANAVAIFDTDLNNPQERENILKPLDNFGLNEMTKSASHNEILATRFVDLTKGGKEADNISEKLLELNSQMKDLDPSKVDFAKKGVFGNLVNPVRKYFAKYQKAEVAISEIVESLDKSSKVLQNDNTTLLNEENYLREVTNKLLADIELGKQMDASIEAQIQTAEIEGVDEEKIAFVKEEILFPLRQRIMDMQQMIVVNQQGIVSLNVIRRNNKELIRGVKRAQNVTVSALRTGVMVASALYDQKIVMEKINILNQTTENIIESTSHMLKEQGSEIQRHSAETMISPEVLKASFAEALQAIEDVSTYKEQALPQMKETIDMFSDMAEDGQKVIAKIETSNDNLIN